MRVTLSLLQKQWRARGRGRRTQGPSVPSLPAACAPEAAHGGGTAPRALRAQPCHPVLLWHPDHVFLSPTRQFKGFSRAIWIWCDARPSEHRPRSPRHSEAAAFRKRSPRDPECWPRGGTQSHQLRFHTHKGALTREFQTCNPKGIFQVPCTEWPTYMCRDFCAFTTSSFEL